MSTFSYRGRTRAGQAVTGTCAAETMVAAVADLRQAGLVVTRIQSAAERRVGRSLSRSGVRGVNAKNLAVFTRQFSVMIDAGLPVVQCLDILASQEQDRDFSSVIRATRDEVERGASLATAMKQHPRTFDPLFTNMIAAGEAGGVLDIILKRLATYIEKSVKLRNQVKAAMMYPAAVLTIAASVIAVVLWKVIPTFSALFAGLGADLPLPTRIVIALSHSVVRFMPIIAAGVVAAIAVSRAYYATSAGRTSTDGLLLQVPVVGTVLRKIAVARFCRTMSTLLASGVSILEAFDITARTAGNAIVEAAVVTTRDSVERGETIAQPLRATAVFPPMVVQMISVGEATGALDTMLAKIADFYEEEVDTAVSGLLTLLEPVMIAVLGVIIGSVVIAMYLPIFGLIGKLAG